MFGLNKPENFGSIKERRIKTAAVAVAAFTVGLYVIFIVLMAVTKLGILSAFIKTKPTVNLLDIEHSPVYEQLDYEYYSKRFNSVFDGSFDAAFYTYFDELGDIEQLRSLPKFNTGIQNLLWVEAPKYERYERQHVTYGTTHYTGSFTRMVGKNNAYILSDGVVVTIPNAALFFILFISVMGLSAAFKIINIARASINGKLVFSNRTTTVKICCIIEVFAFIAFCYVFLWLEMNKMPIINNAIEPSAIYYWGFLFPILALNALFASLYTMGAELEK